MKSRRNSRSISLQLLRNRVLTRGDHEELEIFLEIHLIHFTNRSKVKKIREDTSSFKGEFLPDFEGHLMRSGSGIDGHNHCGDRGLDFASKEAMIVPRSGYDRTTIVGLVHPLSAARWRSGKWVVPIIADQAC